MRPVVWTDRRAALAALSLVGWMMSIEVTTSRRKSRDAARAGAADEQVMDVTTSRLFDLAASLAVVGAAAVACVDVRTDIRARRTSYVAGMGILAGSGLLSSRARQHLGRFHRNALTVHADHYLVDSGPYERVRHPLYLATVGVFVGAGAVLGNWLSVALAGLPTAALVYRISVEERILEDALGKRYSEYQSRTYRLLPGVW